MTDILAARDYLTSEAACRLLSITLGLPPESLVVQKVHSRPDLEVSVIYRSKNTKDEIHPVVTTALIGSERLSTPVGVVSWWLHPRDPNLPGLPDACRPTTVANWLGTDCANVEILTYRPMRRAVLRARTRTGSFYLKVLPPTRAHALVHRHQILGDLGPRLVGTPAPGVVITEQAKGVSLAHSYAAWHEDPAALPPPDSLTCLLDQIPPEVAQLSPRFAWNDRIDFYLTGAMSVLPMERQRIETLGRNIKDLLTASDRGPVVASHGDFYEANIFVLGGNHLTMIDIDSIGPGHRVDDYACLLGHLAVLPDLSPVHYRRLGTVLDSWLDHFSAEVDPISLRARLSGVIVSLILGASGRRASHRLYLAENWAADAMRIQKLR